MIGKGHKPLRVYWRRYKINASEQAIDIATNWIYRRPYGKIGFIFANPMFSKLVRSKEKRDILCPLDKCYVVFKDGRVYQFLKVNCRDREEG